MFLSARLLVICVDVLSVSSATRVVGGSGICRGTFIAFLGHGRIVLYIARSQCSICSVVHMYRSGGTEHVQQQLQCILAVAFDTPGPCSFPLFHVFHVMHVSQFPMLSVFLGGASSPCS